MVGARSVADFTLAVTWASACLVGGCDAFDPGVLDRLQSPVEMPPPQDSGTRDAAPPCVRTGFENCNDLDDDCDGDVDEDADVSCVSPHAMMVCAAGGRCVALGCKTGFADCNERQDDGCEHPLEDGPCPMCTGSGCAEMDAGHEPVPDAEVEEDDAALDAQVEPEDACVAQDEVCDGEDNDCDDKVDETAECAIQQCVATTPSYRGAACDRCVCEKCGAYSDDCQFSTNATWVTQCRAVLECYVVQSRGGNCGSNEDCYGTGGGPCASQINLAAGGSSGTDSSAAVGGGCNATEPPTTACMAATNYRDHCTRDLCATECAN